MIGFEFSRGYMEGIDGRDTAGRGLYIQIGPLLLSFAFSWGRRK